LGRDALRTCGRHGIRPAIGACIFSAAVPRPMIRRAGGRLA